MCLFYDKTPSILNMRASKRAGATFNWTFFDNSKLINFDD